MRHSDARPYERAARVLKLGKLERAVDLLARRALKRDPHEPVVAYALTKTLATWTPAHWARVAVCAGTRPPSDTTIKELIEVYAQRAGRTP